MKQILVTICARAGSKGVAGKNVRDFCELPIAYYSMAAYTLFLDRYGGQYTSVNLALNTDSELLKQQFDSAKLDYDYVERKASLAGDVVSKIDVIRDTLSEMELRTGRQYDLIVDIDLTSPLRRAEDIQNVIEALLACDSADIALSLTEGRRNPYFNQLVMGADGYYHTAIRSDYIARQQAPTVYDANASLYAYRPGYLKNTGGIFLNAKLVGSMMADTGILDIDSERDFCLMEVIARYFFAADEEFAAMREQAERLHGVVAVKECSE